MKSSADAMRAIALRMTEPGAFAGEIYMPEGLRRHEVGKPVDRGLEIKIAEKLARLESLNEEARKAGRGRRRGQGR